MSGTKEIDSHSSQSAYIAVIFTGGTISSKYDKECKVINLKREDKLILDQVTSFFEHEFIRIKPFTFSNMPSPHFDINTTIELISYTESILAQESILGAVILQGTDNIEETSYFFDLLLDSNKPVIFTGSMKSNGDYYNDAVGNLFGSINLAISLLNNELGVLVFFNERFYYPEFVIKYDANNINSFIHTNNGYAGTFIDGVLNVLSYKKPKNKYHIDRMTKFVPLLKVYLGIDERVVSNILSDNIDGIVIEGYGSGNLPPIFIKYIEKLIKKGIPVVVCTRCISGNSIALYNYKGGGADLKNMGVIMAREISALKARIKLSVLLEVNNDINFITNNFHC